MKTVETCSVEQKQEYYYGKPTITNGLCNGYLSSKKPHNALKSCQKCKLWSGIRQKEDIQND